MHITTQARGLTVKAHTWTPQEGDTDEDEVGEGLWASGRQSRQRSRKHFGKPRGSRADVAPAAVLHVRFVWACPMWACPMWACMPASLQASADHLLLAFAVHCHGL